MNILVLVKPVPDPEKYTEIKIDQETKCLVREGVETVVNPTDKNALEEGLRIRDNCIKAGEASKVTVLAMALESAGDKLLSCLAMGADKAILLSDRKFAGSDTYATSYILAQAIRYICSEEGEDEFDLILAGNESADGGTAHVPVQVAEWLNIPYLNRICQVEYSQGQIEATKKTETQLIQFEGERPALLSLTRDINEPRHINAMGIVKARKKPMRVITNEELNLEDDRIGLKGSTTKPGDLLSQELSRGGKALDGETAEDAAKAIMSLVEQAR
ncbi:MAG: electron transfer flavoprotein subunit beta/FixA family protein [Bacillota bacterium]|nr:electron transfer flavoprotein subunit beta/FixA family protein [Bacillota bacterium]